MGFFKSATQTLSPKSLMPSLYDPDTVTRIFDAVSTNLNKSKEPYDDKRDNSNGDSDSISKSSDCDDVSTDTSPTTTSHLKDVVTESLSRYSNINPDSLGNSGVSPKDDDATLYDDEYNYEGKDCVQG
ncbi:hypothetical protein Tco_0911558 [Tanacetum coccineum]|uniref:Uncharacterized protein n=1 Tax=Tanacetum coccineum TaxID=301880 RepID=A0ABQ5CX56_9ASTR